MARFSTALAALAAASLTLAHPTAAFAQDDEDAASSEDEGDSGLPEGLGMVIGILGVLALVFIIMAITDDNNPSSP